MSLLLKHAFDTIRSYECKHFISKTNFCIFKHQC